MNEPRFASNAHLGPQEKFKNFLKQNMYNLEMSGDATYTLVLLLFNHDSMSRKDLLDSFLGKKEGPGIVLNKKQQNERMKTENTISRMIDTGIIKQEGKYLSLNYDQKNSSDGKTAVVNTTRNMIGKELNATKGKKESDEDKKIQEKFRNFIAQKQNMYNIQMSGDSAFALVLLLFNHDSMKRQGLLDTFLEKKQGIEGLPNKKEQNERMKTENTISRMIETGIIKQEGENLSLNYDQKKSLDEKMDIEVAMDVLIKAIKDALKEFKLTVSDDHFFSSIFFKKYLKQYLGCGDDEDLIERAKQISQGKDILEMINKTKTKALLTIKAIIDNTRKAIRDRKIGEQTEYTIGGKKISQMGTEKIDSEKEEDKQLWISHWLSVSNLYDYIDRKLVEKLPLDKMIKPCIDGLSKFLDKAKEWKAPETKFTIAKERFIEEYENTVLKHVRKLSETIATIKKAGYALDQDNMVRLLDDLYEFHSQQQTGGYRLNFKEKNDKIIAGFYHAFDQLFKNKPNIKKGDLVSFYDTKRHFGGEFIVKYDMQGEIPSVAVGNEKAIFNYPPSLLKKVEKVEKKRFKLVEGKPKNKYEITQSDIKACDPKFAKGEQENKFKDDGDLAHVVVVIAFPRKHIHKGELRQIMIRDQTEGNDFSPKKLKELEERIDDTINNMIEKGYVEEKYGDLTLMIDLMNKH